MFSMNHEFKKKADMIHQCKININSEAWISFCEPICKEFKLIEFS